MAGERTAGAVPAVAAPLARRPPEASQALALARLLRAGRDAAGALEAAPPAPPARQAAAQPAQGVAVGRGGVALALLPAAGCPPARLAVAGAAQGVAAAVGAALAGELAEPSPVVGVAGAVAAHGVAAPVGVARAALLAVVAPVLLGAACGGKGHSQDGEKPGSPPSTQLALKGGGQGLSAAGTLTGTAVCSEEAGLAAAEPRFQAHLALPAGVLPLAHGCRGRKGTQHSLAPPSIPRETTIPLPPPSLRLSRSTISS